MKTRREFLATTVAAAALLTNGSGQTAASLSRFPIADDTGSRDTESNDSALGGQDMTDRAEDPRVRRARLSGPEHVTKDATVAEIAADGNMTVLVQGTNEWVCTPGNENKIGDPPMWIGHLKDNAGTGSLYRSQHEFILVFKQGKGSHRNNVQLGQLGRYRTNVGWMIANFQSDFGSGNRVKESGQQVIE